MIHFYEYVYGYNYFSVLKVVYSLFTSYRSESDECSECSDTEDCHTMSMEVYPGSKVTVLGAYCLLMEFKRLCKLPFSTMVILLNLLQLLCPVGNLLPKTKHQLVKFTRNSSSRHYRIDFCRSCNEVR